MIQRQITETTITMETIITETPTMVETTIITETPTTVETTITTETSTTVETTITTETSTMVETTIITETPTMLMLIIIRILIKYNQQMKQYRQEMSRVCIFLYLECYCLSVPEQLLLYLRKREHINN